MLNANKKKSQKKIKISSIHWLEATYTNTSNIKNKGNLLVAWVAAEKLLKLAVSGERGDQAAARWEKPPVLRSTREQHHCSEEQLPPTDLTQL